MRGEKERDKANEREKVNWRRMRKKKEWKSKLTDRK